MNGTAIAGVTSASFPGGGSRSQARRTWPQVPARRSRRSSASETQVSTPICPVTGSGEPGVGGVRSLTALDLLQRRGAEETGGPDEHEPDQDPEHDQVGEVPVEVAL